ncbi:YkgJ family cysteine cluster protein [Chitinibacter sp. SCUT-21]|uniref:YkgJ family cysteine cluster protein n=1 Tax=Chitinibacter sp. SCUT-21 TaxID=2970891 RepID=UPI0035A689F4
MSHPCLSCGACCAHYRVSFYFGESDATEGGTVPDDLVEPISPFYVAMRGTNQPNPRCTSLVGTVGQSACCGIYELRSSSCKELQAADERCNKARAKYGLPPLSKADLVGFE